MTRPIRTVPHRSGLREGWWTATVLSVIPTLDCNIPEHSGPAGVVKQCRSAVFDPPLAPGDLVYCAHLDGQPDVFVVCSRRQT